MLVVDAVPERALGAVPGASVDDVFVLLNSSQAPTPATTKNIITRDTSTMILVELIVILLEGNNLNSVTYQIGACSKVTLVERDLI